MANTLTTPKRAFGKLFNAIAIATALCASAQAAVIDFEAVDSPIVLDGQRTALGDYYIDSYGEGIPDSLVGTMGNNDLCSGFGYTCPVGNGGNYYNVLADSYFVLGKSNNQNFKVEGLKASFIGANQSTFGGIAGALELIGFDANNQEVAYLPLFLKGPVGGSFAFENFDLGAFGSTHLSYLLVVGWAYENGTFNRNGNRANFAIDDIVTYVPEPGTFALMGLGLLGLGALSRRRSA